MSETQISINNIFLFYMLWRWITNEFTGRRAFMDNWNRLPNIVWRNTI